MKLALPALLVYSLGLLVLGSVSPNLFGTQLVFGLVAIVVFITVSRIDYQIIFSLHPLFSILTTILLVLTFVLGELTRGTHRWLDFGAFSLQPSELAKPFLLVSFTIISLAKHKSITRYILLLFLVILPSLLIFLQPDLGTFLVIGAGFFVIHFSKIIFKRIFLMFIIFLLIIPPAYKFVLKPYQKDRLITFINPYADPLGKGYHVIQSVISVGSGGTLGKGLGQGSQSQLRFLPEQHTDFIFASLTEELGLVGGTLVLFLYGMLFYQIYRISQTTTDTSCTLFCLGSLGMLMFQLFVNIGMNIGIAPITGVTLPLMSYGGSSLLSLSIIFGLISNISSQNRLKHI